MTSRTILQVFENYQKARLAFAQSISDLAQKQENIQIMKGSNVIILLKSLIVDICPPIRQCAAMALGRIINNDPNIAKEFVDAELISLLLYNASIGNKYQRTAVLFTLRSICKDSEQMAEVVIKSGGLQTLIFCLDGFDSNVKESAAWCLGYIARHNQKLAQDCANSGVLPLLMLCLQEPELNLKQITTNAVADIAKHSEDLAMSVVDAGIAPYLVKNLQNNDDKLKKQCLSALSAVAHHSSELSEVVVEAGIFPSVLQHFRHPCVGVRRNAAILVRDIAKQSLELTQLVVNSGGIGALVGILLEPEENEKNYHLKLPSVSALGFIAGQTAHLALTVISCHAVPALANLLYNCTDDNFLTASVWTLGQIGRHSPEHVNAIIANQRLLPKLIEWYESAESSNDLKSKCHATLKMVLQNCIDTNVLERLLFTAPPEILKYVLGQYSKILPHDPKARRLFITSGALKKVQLLDAIPGTALMEYITVINSCFPEEIVRFYSPGYPESLLDKVEQFSPQVLTILRDTIQADGEAQTDTAVEKSNNELLSSNSDSAKDIAMS